MGRNLSVPCLLPSKPTPRWHPRSNACTTHPLQRLEAVRYPPASHLKRLRRELRDAHTGRRARSLLQRDALVQGQAATADLPASRLEAGKQGRGVLLAPEHVRRHGARDLVTHTANVPERNGRRDHDVAQCRTLLGEVATERRRLI